MISYDIAKWNKQASVTVGMAVLPSKRYPAILTSNYGAQIFPMVCRYYRHRAALVPSNYWFLGVNTGLRKRGDQIALRANGTSTADSVCHPIDGTTGPLRLREFCSGATATGRPI